MRPSRRAPVSSLHALIASAVLGAGAGCATSSNTYPVDAPARAATAIPDRFMVGTMSSGGGLSEAQPNAGCRNPMVDPRDGTRLTLLQSQPGASGAIGDYEVPGGRYGVGTGELLRLDCGSGRVIGIVPRGG